LGELLESFKLDHAERGARKAKGDVSPSFSQREVARAAGLSKDQEKEAVRVAAVPREQFEEMVESGEPPTISTLAEIATPRPSPGLLRSQAPGRAAASRPGVFVWAQLASACQSFIRKDDAVGGLHRDEAHLDQGVKCRALALVVGTASPGQSDASQ
jgi:hypothetical protein